MPLFTYQGLDARGQKRSGEVTAGSRGEALRLLLGDKIQPVSLAFRGADSPRAAAKRNPILPTAAPITGSLHLTGSQVILFTDELADFLHSGLQLEPALHLMETREEKSPVQTVARILREKIRDGTSFSEALRQASPSFGELYANLVAAGEISGSLAPLLRRQAIYLIAAQDLRNRVLLALIYPGFLICGGIVAIVAFMTVLVPQMTALFAQTNSTIPLPTFILIKLGDFFKKDGIATGLVLALAIGLFIIYTRQPAGRRWWDQNKLAIPLVGPLLRASFLAQFSQTLANLLQNGLPLLSALKLVCRATGNVFWQELLIRATNLVGEGASLTRALRSTGHFPANFLDLIKVGEQTGEMGDTLAKVSQRYEKIIQQRVDRIMALIQPVIIIVLGGMVILIGGSMLSGIFQAMHGLQAHH